ncbi:hypothetical protein NVP1244A_129 [Vibrio phage 1.244.A._10N.261.54.C3]|nr:hypothetical protein NVP1244A_129 [Vibrio phage 1.244.A._10N.261.54.C3]AUR98757.1 hypothetical protein NVP1255O_129 [Vibrio phage 1.255.O._10N.286.45.F1]
MAATKKQIDLCTLLIDNGAPFELKHPHEDSVEAADAFIKANQKYFRGANKHPNYYDAALGSGGIRPEDYGVLNH